MSDRVGFLHNLLLDVVSDRDYIKRDIDGKPGDETCCNLAFNRICIAYGIFSFEGKMANGILETLRGGLEGWAEATEHDASVHANMGELAVVGKEYPEHGHIAVLWPDKMQHSSTFKRQVPMVANVGAENGIMRMSGAFAASKGEPTYWTYSRAKKED